MTWEVGDLVQCDMQFTAHTISDKPDGYIAGIASTPGTDSYGHRVAKGAFDDSIAKRGLNKGEGVKLLLGHDWHKPAGPIKRLATVGDNLEIEAQLTLTSGYVRDLYEVAKDIGGLNFSVGFRLQSFEFVDDEDIESDDDPWLIVKTGDLMEVSVVVFPALREAQMTHIKEGAPVKTIRELERYMAYKLSRSRTEVQRFIRAMKPHAHLFRDVEAPAEPHVITPKHPGLDAPMLTPVHAQLVRMKSVFGSG